MRLLRRLITAILLLLLLLVVFAYQQWRPLWKELGVEELSYKFGKISWRQLDLDAVSFRYSTAQTEYKVALEQLRLTWHWRGVMPRLDLVKMQRLSLESIPDSTTTASTTPMSMRAQWQLPAWLPSELAIIQLEAVLPCATESCPVSGSLYLSQQPSQDWQLVLTLSPTIPADPNRQLRFKADYRLREGLPQMAYALVVPPFLSLQGETGLTAQKIYNWQGALALEVSPPPAWATTALAAWGLAYDTQKLPAFTSAGTVKANWEMTLLAGSALTIQALSSADTKLDIALNLPDSVPLPALGLISGFAQFTLHSAQGQVNDYRASADIKIEEPKLPAALSELGVAVRSAQIKLASGSEEGLDLAALPLQLSLQTSDATQIQLHADLLLNTQSPYALIVNHGELEIRSPRLAIDELIANQLDIRSGFSGNWQGPLVELKFLQPTILAASLDSSHFHTLQCRLSSEQIVLAGKADKWRQLSINGNLRLAADKLKANHLLTQNWQWQATLEGRTEQLRLDALLTNTAGLNLTHHISYRPGLLDLNWQLEDIFLLAGNPIRQTISDWPTLLDINRGRIAAKGNLRYNLQTSALTTDNQVALKDISAIYDRSLLQGLSAQIKVHTIASQLQADVQLQIDQFNQGIVFGPLLSRAQYHAAFNSPLSGMLDLAQLNVRLMGGEVSLAPQSLDLSLPEQVLPFIMTDLELAQLLAQHPTSELSGNGRLSGKIPVRIGANGVSVEAGAVAAIAPGGQLQYRPGNAAGMAASNKAMKLVVDALNDFHYSVLTSDVSYDNQGKLTLGLKLAGNNPSFEGGRAINLNINLEEDIPALLTSLQLSSKISDKIKQRVQQHFLKQQGTAAPTGAQHERP